MQRKRKQTAWEKMTEQLIKVCVPLLLLVVLCFCYSLIMMPREMRGGAYTRLNAYAEEVRQLRELCVEHRHRGMFGEVVK